MFQNSLMAGAAGQGGFYDYQIDQSLRFNDDDSAYLSRTPASAGDRQTWTWSGWVKRGNLGSRTALFEVRVNGTNFCSLVLFETNAIFAYSIVSAIDYGFLSNDIFRDTSAWYHIVWVMDTTNATSSDRMRLYVNNRRITSFSANYGEFPLNYEPLINTTSGHNIGLYVDTGNYFDGYMAEVNFIDGQALDPTDFGQLKSDIWIPKKYTGSYGTNGFYLTFEDSAAIGDDLSGNANDWTANNLVASDVVLDSPTNNFCALSPLVPNTLALSEGNLKFTGSSASAYRAFGNTAIPSSGKWYFECYIGSDSAQLTECGIGQMDNGYPTGAKLRTYRSSGQKNGTSFVAYGATYTTGDVIGVAVDIDAGEIEFFKNNVSQGVAWTDLGDAEWHPFVSEPGGGTVGIITTNFGQDSSFAGNKTAQGNTDGNGQGDFYYTPPSGYLALNTANLPDPAIDPAEDDAPADYFNTVLYTGNGTYPRSITGVGFQPDFVWIKTRSYQYGHALYDVVRGTGTTKSLYTNSTDAEGAFSASINLSSFDVDGFSIGSTSSNNALNDTSNTRVAWNWLAGNGTSTNTDGDLTSTVSVNQKSGFSIVGFDLETTGSKTVGHGLGVAPKMVILRSRDPGASGGLWLVYHAGIAADAETDFLMLHSTSAAADNNTVWDDTAPTSSVFTVGSGITIANYGVPQIAYCFAEVEGFSKFGSYTGNGSADGPFVYCGFRPAFVMIKRANNTGSWYIHDKLRAAEYNPQEEVLLAEASNAVQFFGAKDFVSNGFKIRDTASGHNASGGTYIFMAFAEQPFKYANAR